MGKGENLGTKPGFSPFSLNFFLSSLRRNLILAACDFLSLRAHNLDQSKILLFG